jgi:Polyketide cyclase / dehydrase and lipid transport
MGLGSTARNWGSTAAEREMAFPCDRYVSEFDQELFRAIDVEAPAAIVFRWLCQLRAAPYSYDWIDNLGRRSPQTLTPGLERLAEGQRVMTIFELVEFEPGTHLTIRLRRPRFMRDLAVTYLVEPVTEWRSRLLVKMRAAYRGGLVGAWTVGALLPSGDLMMMRRQLLNLKQLAEATWAAERFGRT